MKIKLIIAVLLTYSLTGCGTYGEPLLLAAMYDSSDSCQRQNWSKNGGSMPSFCGASRGRTTIYATPHNAPIGPAVGYFKQ